MSNVKPRITIFHCGFIYTGGGERIVLEEVKELRRRGYEVECFAPTLDKKTCYPDIIDEADIKTFLPQLPKWVPFRFAILMVMSCILAPLFMFRFIKTDLFIGANQPGAYLAWVMAKLLGKPYFIYLNQPNRILYPRDGENWQSVSDYYLLNYILQHFRYPIILLDKLSIVKADKVFINGHFIARELAKVYGLKKWIDCPAGVNGFLRLGGLDRKDFWQGRVKINGKSAKKPYILLTSRHVPWKRFDWVIRVMKKIIEKVPGARLVIPGAFTSETKNLIRLSRELGIENKIIFPGEISQESLRRLYNNASVFCFPSPEEDLGIVVLEAQAAGMPVVAWDYGGPTVTVVDGKTGFLVNPYSLNQMAKRIIKLLTDRALCRKMGRAAQNHIKQNFTWEKHVDILEKEYENLRF